MGTVDVFASGVPIPLGDDQRITLAALVAVGETGTTRSELYFELFAGRPQSSGEQAVTMRVHRLRNKLEASGGERAALRAGSRFGIDPTRCVVDVWDLERQLDADDRPTQLAGLRRWDEPFHGLIDDPPVVLTARERLRIAYRSCLIRVAPSVAVGDGDDLIDAMVGQLDVGPVDEQLVVGTAIALYRTGRQAEALTIIHDARKQLIEDHGLRAGPDLDEVESAILNHGPRIRARRPGRPAIPTDADADTEADTEADTGRAFPTDRVVGRDDISSVLVDAVVDLGRAGCGVPPVHLITGSAGSGKSTLIQLVRERCGTEVAFRVGRPESTVRRPFEHVRSLLPELAARLDPGSDPGVDQPHTRWELVHRHLSELASVRPVVVVFEDLHDVDSHTVDLLRFLLSTPRPAQLLYLLTARPVESPGSDPVADMTASLDADGEIERHQLAPLTHDHIRNLVALDHPSESARTREAFAARLFELSQGLPMVASVLSRDAEPGLSTVLLPHSITPEEGLARHLTARIDDPELDRLLSAAALIGHEFDAGLLTAVTSMRRETVEGLLERAAELHVCEPVAAERWRFDHLLTMNYFASRLGFFGPILCARLAERTSATDINVVRYVLGAGPELPPATAVTLLTDASSHLEAHLAFAEAATALSHLLNLLDPAGPVAPPDPSDLSGSTEPTADLLIRLAACRARSGDFDGARAVRKDAFKLADTVGDAERMLAAAIAGLPAAERAGGDPDRLAMLRSIDGGRLSARSRVELNRWMLRQARICNDVDTMAAVVERMDPAWESVDAASWHALELERLAIEVDAGRPALDETLDLAARIDKPELRAEAFMHAAVTALQEQRREAFDESYHAAAKAIGESGSARSRWTVDLLDAALTTAGLDGFATSIDQAQRSGFRWGIPDVFEAWYVQVYVSQWLDGAVAPMAGFVAQLRGENAEGITNLAWLTAEALARVEGGEPAVATTLAQEAAALMDAEPELMYAGIAAALLAETAYRLNEPALARSATAVLAPRQGQSLVLGTGVAHLGPVDRYLGLAAEAMEPGSGVALLRAAADQCSRSGMVRWHQRCLDDLSTGGT